MLRILLLSCLLIAAGCATTSKGEPDGYFGNIITDDGYRVPAGPSDVKRASADGTVEVETVYKVTPVHTRLPAIFGTRMKAAKVGQKQFKEELLVPLRFAFSTVTNSESAIVREIGSDAYLRYDVRTGKTSPYKFETLGLVKAGVRGKSGYVGTTRQPNGRWTVTLLGYDARPVATLTDVRDGAFAKPSSVKVAASTSQPVDYLDGDVFVVHFDPPEGEPSSAIYNRQGVQITPSFPSIGRVLGVIDPTVKAWELAPKHTATLPLDDPSSPESAGLVWPMRDDGSIDPKPEGLLGLKPMHLFGVETSQVFAWQVAWQTPQGLRYAIHPHFVIDPAALQATRDNAIYTRLEVTARTMRDGGTGTKTVVAILATQAPNADPNGPWLAMTHYQDGTLLPVYDEAMDYDGLRRKLYDDGVSARQTAYEADKARYEQEMARLERERQVQRDREAAIVQAREAERARMRDLLAKRYIEAAERVAWTVDVAAVVEVARAAPDEVSLNALSRARAAARTTEEAKRLDGKISYRQYQADQLARKSRPSQSKYVGSGWSPQSIADYNRDAHKSRMDWIEGKTNVYVPNR